MPYKILLNMSNKKNNILVWFDQGPYSYLNLGLSVSISKIQNFDFFGIIATQQDMNFFNSQQLLPFKQLLYYPECYQNKSNYDINFLSQYEKNLNLNLWLDIYSERFFHKYRTYFHTFSKSEILTIVDNSIKFFYENLMKINPTLVIMQTAGENFANILLFKIAKSLKIPILMINPIHIHNKVVISNNLTSNEISNDFQKIISNFNNELIDYDPSTILNNSLLETVKVQKTFNFNNKNTSQKLKHYFNRIFSEPELIYQNVGKTKSKMIRSKITTKIETKERKSFLDKTSISSIEDQNFIYFPLHTEPEAKILSTSPFYSNQLATIENIARSIPINYVLYVKEHPGQELKNWRDISFYQNIIDLPNVKLVHPSVNPQTLISQCAAVISITGSTGFEALFYKKPVILFSDEYYDDLSMVFKVDNLIQLPSLIKKALSNFEFNNKEFNALIESTNINSLDIPYFEIMKNALDVSSYHRNHNNVGKTEKRFLEFYKKYEDDFNLLAKQFISKLSQEHQFNPS